MKKVVIFFLFFLVLAGFNFIAMERTASAAVAAGIAPYSDVRNQDLRAYDLDPGTIRTLWFNENTLWHRDDRDMARQIMEEGKNPGLGVRSIHSTRIRGTGVNVAIIDQNMYLDHPEFAGKIVKYVDFGCNTTVGSMHGPAVASLLVGETIGTAPGANVYYAAVPSWQYDAAYFADALNWIIKVNSRLPSGQKIRVVSVSAAPSGPGSAYSNGPLWDQACLLARANQILVLDCTSHQGIIGPCYYDVRFPEMVSFCIPGFPQNPFPSCPAARDPIIHAPNSFRTQAEQTSAGAYSHQYMGQGGISWSVPYVAGVLALGWQERPWLSGDEMVSLLRNSAYDRNGCKIIDPVNFLNLVSSR